MTYVTGAATLRSSAHRAVYSKARKADRGPTAPSGSLPEEMRHLELLDVFEAGGGWMAQVRWQRSPGFFFDLSREFGPEHVAQAWHTSCEAIFTRLHAYERAMYGVEGFSPVPNSLVTLTDPAHGQQSGEEPLYWFGDLSGGVREANPETEAVEGSCQDILKTVNITLSNVDVTSCCGSFILPGVWTQGHPRAVYEALFRAVVDETKDDALTSQQCFEFIVYALFSPKILCPLLYAISISHAGFVLLTATKVMFFGRLDFIIFKLFLISILMNFYKIIH